MKKLITTLALFCISIINAQYTHSFNGYTRDNADEIQFSFIPISISKNLEVSQLELGWRKGAHSISFRYGLDSNETNYYDINSNVYFFINKYFDVTFGAGFGTRTNINFTIKNESDKYYIPYNFGIVLKPSEKIQVITRLEKLGSENGLFWQTGLIFKLPISNK